MIIHHIQKLLNGGIFLIGAYLFLNYGDKKFEVATLSDLVLTVIGVILMFLVYLIFSEPCHRHKKTTTTCGR